MIRGEAAAVEVHSLAMGYIGAQRRTGQVIVPRAERGVLGRTFGLSPSFISDATSDALEAQNDQSFFRTSNPLFFSPVDAQDTVVPSDPRTIGW